MTVRRRIGLIAATLAVAFSWAPPVEGAYIANIGNDDTLIVYTPSETKWAIRALENPQSWICAPAGVRLPTGVRALNRLCSFSSLARKILFWRAKTFLMWAAHNGGCGAIVIDGASWRPPRIRAAQHWNAPSRRWVDFVWANPGETTYFKTARGWVKVLCNDYSRIDFGS